jgi:hypothetical protein
MPTISTGNTAWDQGLGALSGALFPDPSKVAAAGYYGAEQRKAQIDAAKVADQLANAHRLAGMSANPGGTYQAPAYAPAPGVNMPLITQDPNAAPPSAPSAAPPVPSLSTTVAGAPPPVAAAPPPPAPSAPSAAPPAPTLSATVAGAAPVAAAPPSAPPAPPPPAAGTVGANMAPGALAALFAQGGGAVQQQPQVIARGPNGGAVVQPTMTPGQVADNTPAMVDAHPTLTQGTPPATSSPAPGSGAPPASNGTASDGSVPNQDPVSGIFHPGSITPPGGGQKTTGPANANGSPAQPVITQAQYVATAVASGMDAAQANLQWRSYIESMFQKGMIDQNTYHHMMGSADPSIINTDTTTQGQIRVAGIGAASAANVARIQEEGRIAAQNIVTNEDREKFLNQEVQTTDPTNPSRMILVKRKDLQPGQLGYDSAAAVQAGKPIPVIPPGGGTAVNMPSYQTTMPGPNQPGYYDTTVQNTIQTQRGQPGKYIDPNNPTQIIPATFDDARRQGLVEVPQTMDGWNALAASASVNAKTPEEAQAIRDKVLAFATAQKPVDANESLHNSIILNRQLQLQMPVPMLPDGVPFFRGTLTNQEPAGASPELELTLSNLTDQYFTRSTDPTIHGNRVGAANAAIQQLIRQGYINPQQDRSMHISGQTSINKPILNSDGTTDQVPHFRIDIRNPKIKNPDDPSKEIYPPGQAPMVQMAPSISSTVADAVAKNQPPAGAIAKAPAGAANGRKSINPPGVVRDGWVFPQ